MQKNKAKEKNAEQSGERKIVLHPTVLVLGTYILLLLSKIIDVTLINRDNEYLSVAGTRSRRSCRKDPVSDLPLRSPQIPP